MPTGFAFLTYGRLAFGGLGLGDGNINVVLPEGVGDNILTLPDVVATAAL